MADDKKTKKPTTTKAKKILQQRLIKLNHKIKDLVLELKNFSLKMFQLKYQMLQRYLLIEKLHKFR